MKRFDLVIFDLDGTLADTALDIQNGVNYAMDRVGLKRFKFEEVLGYIGGGARALIQKCLSGRDLALLEEVYQHFLDYYKIHLLDNTRLYPDVEETLESLKGVIKAVVTNKPFLMSDEILSKLGVASHFKKILGGDSLPEKKPAPLPVLTLLEEFRIPKERALLVGDTLIDIETARRAGISSCVVLYGYNQGQDLSEADFLLKEFRRLKEIIFYSSA
jgi:phosphoglycolate phosphatase